MADDDFDVRPGRSRDAGAQSYDKARTLVGKVLQASRRAGRTPLARGRRSGGTGHLGRGKRAALQRRRNSFQRRVVIKARVVRHKGTSFRSAPLARHLSYLEREGAGRDGADGTMFDERSQETDGDAFARRCEDDRHHFRFIVSPEDARDMADLRAFTRELMTDMASDLGTRLDWVAVDHWNTDNPHVHVLVRGVADDGRDLVIDRTYISAGLRGRAEERITAELGPRSEREIRSSLSREVDAQSWTGLDRTLVRRRDERGVVDLRSGAVADKRDYRTFLLGRAQVLERMGVAERVGPASWTLAADMESTLRELGDRGDIIKTMHRAMSGRSGRFDPTHVALHVPDDRPRVIGRLADRGLHNELTGEAYAIVEGTDGRAHHLRFPDLDRTGDASIGAVVETSTWTNRRGDTEMSMLTRSDMPLEAQVTARGATWLDRQLVSPRPEALVGDFGSQVAEALAKRTEQLLDDGLAKRQGQRVVFARNLLETLREREIADAGEALADRTGGLYRPSLHGDHVTGVYRERVVLASGRFAMIDDGLGFQLVPWRQDMDRHLGSFVNGKINERGSVDWSFSRARGPAL